MTELVSRVPINFRWRSTVSAVRVFPTGCGRLTIYPNPNVAQEPKDKEIENELVNNEKCEKGEFGISEKLERVKVDGHVEEESGDLKRITEGNVEERESFGLKKLENGNAEESLSSKKIIDKNVEEETNLKKSSDGNLKKNFDENVESSNSKKVVDGNVELSSNLANGSATKEARNMIGTCFLKRSKVSAVRSFPTGCGRNVSINNSATSLGGGPTDKDESIGHNVQESKRESGLTLMKVVSSSGQKKKYMVVGESSYKQLKNEANQVQVKGKQVNKEAMFESSEAKISNLKMKHLAKKKVMLKIKLSGQDCGSKDQCKTRMDENAREVMLEENKEEQSHPLSDNLAVNKSRDAMGSSRFRLESKVGKIVAKKSVASIDNLKGGKSMKRKLQDEEVDESLEAYGDKSIVHASMSEKKCPWRKGKISSSIVSHSATPYAKRRKPTISFVHSVPQSKNAVKAEYDLLQYDSNKKSHNTCVTMTSSIPYRKYIKEGSSSSNKEVVARNMVKRALRLYQLISRQLLQGEEKLRGILSNDKTKPKRVDLEAAGILKNSNVWVNHEKAIIGPVPGVEVGDEFHFRVELSIIGLHRPFQAGIDFSNKNGYLLATSIVASGGYPDDVDSSDVLIYSGSGGVPCASKNIRAGDQKLERGNLGLKNCIDARSPVRVVYGSRESTKAYGDSRPKLVSTFTYDGLYLVERFWPEIGNNDFTVYKFQLRRIPDQPDISLKEIKKVKNSKIRAGLIVNDISDGKETMRICAINIKDNERPMPFKYINKVIYPSSRVLKPSVGCDCKDGCSNAKKCACIMKNGGEIPYNFNGAIVEAKVLVYECGPKCKCPHSCYNRVSQRGIQLPLEIFKTDHRGWGVRSLSSIPSGTFVCEYVGEILDAVETESRVNDEYLFDIGNNYDDYSSRGGRPSYIPSMHCDVVYESGENGGFTIDAARWGNVGRFINHSCTPNLYAQNVLYDHDEKKMPHIMFFAFENIPPLKELTFHYNYALDHVRDEHGNVKKKNCYCGSPQCSGRLY